MKKALAAIAILVLVLAGLVFVLPLALGSDSLRAALARQLSTASGAEISLNGPVRFSVFPDFGIVADDLSYVSGDGSVSVAAGRTVASVSLTSLLSDRIRITGIELVDPRITLSEAKGGQGEVSPDPTEERDVFKLAADYLDTLAIDGIRVRNGEITESDGSGPRSIVSGIDLRLSMPGIDKPASIAFSGIVGGRKMELKGEIGSLRDLLERRPAEFSLSAEVSPAPHPMLAELGISGRIQLADDGSYRIVDGEITSADQPMSFDAAYLPGDRPYIKATIKAGELDYADFQPAGEPAAGKSKESASGSGPDLSALRDIDLDFDLQADAIRVGKAVARDLAVQATLRDGKLKSTIGSQQIAGGGLDSGIFANFNEAAPEITGFLNLSAIDIASLTKLAGRDVPAAGRLSSKLQYAFLGTDPAAIRDTINMKGLVTIKDGAFDIPQLADAAGAEAGRITAFDAKAEITDITQPLAVSGTADWNGESVGFATSIALTDLMAGKATAVAIDLKSRLLAAKFSGTAAMNGNVKGKAVIETASAGKLLHWIGRDAGLPVSRFAFSGTISATGEKLAAEGARITLDDMSATGSASVDMAKKTTIKASLAFDALDFAKLVGGGTEDGKAPSDPSSATDIDLSALRQFDADISLTANRIGYGAVKAGPATATLTVEDGIARLSVPEAGFYDGSAVAEVIANGAGKVPAIDLDASLAGVNALPFLTDAAGFKRLEGKLDAKVKVEGAGASTDALARSLGGEARIVFSDGAIRGIDIAKLVGNIQSLIKGGYKENAEDRTEFTQLSVSYAIKDGVARTQDLRLIGPLVRMDGSGDIDLANRSIDMRLNPRVVGSLDGQGGEFDVSGLGMPVIVSGPLSGPRIYPDITNILANPKQILQTLSKLGGGVGKLVNGASGQASGLENALGGGAGAAAGNVASELIERLKDGNGERTGSGTVPADTGDAIGSLLQDVLGQGTRQDQSARPENETALPRQEEPANPDTQLPDAEARQGEDTTMSAPGPESAVILPTSDIPIPTPNPRRQASAADPPVEGPVQTESRTDQLIDQTAPATTGGGTQGGAADLIKGLIEQIGK